MRFEELLEPRLIPPEGEQVEKSEQHKREKDQSQGPPEGKLHRRCVGLEAKTKDWSKVEDDAVTKGSRRMLG